MLIAIRELPVACKPVVVAGGWWLVAGGGLIELGRLCGARLYGMALKRGCQFSCPALFFPGAGTAVGHRLAGVASELAFQFLTEQGHGRV